MSQTTFTNKSMTNSIQSFFKKERIELAISVYAGFYLLAYGYAKLVQGQFVFEGEMLERPVGELSGFELTWVFFGHSVYYAYIIGITQIIGAILLFPRKTRLLGVFILIPILVNIVLVDVFYQIPHGATVNAIFFLLCLFTILLMNREKLLTILKMLFLNVTDKPNIKNIVISLLIIIPGFAILQLMNMLLNYLLKYVL
ncbi:hypothetical protein [Chondrinema litorale]|uniref:hypothetical protein n=1 Tax=Chondrinema litorale TaxID=2994555 RepID=UPI002542972E|nr:hypothetical protein [Chondrinema litorale]UZR95699.1 hypothetical protein OQ292_07730 [Chondrinema litorale]